MRRTTRPLGCALACLLSLASGPALGTTAEPATEATPDPFLEALQAEAERYPQSYEVAVRLAEAAAAATAGARSTTADDS